MSHTQPHNSSKTARVYESLANGNQKTAKKNNKESVSGATFVNA
jgi:hypothetical protein